MPNVPAASHRRVRGSNAVPLLLVLADSSMRAPTPGAPRMRLRVLLVSLALAPDGTRRDQLNQAPCLACHKPQEANSYVFTIDVLRKAAG